MKIKTDYYGFFVKSNGKWSKSPYKGELVTRYDIIWNSDVEEHHVPFEVHLKSYLKQVRKHNHKQTKLMRQVWEG